MKAGWFVLFTVYSVFLFILYYFSANLMLSAHHLKPANLILTKSYYFNNNKKREAVAHFPPPSLEYI
jgi:hypothetical protein